MSLVAELQRRNVLRLAGLYLVGAWLIVQVAATLLPAFGAPAWALRSVVIALAVCFVPALVLAWVFELTPEGLRRDPGVTGEAAAPTAPAEARRIDRWLVVVLALALGYFALDKFLLAPQRDARARAEAGVQRPVAQALPSIAVLPFTNLSSDPEQAYFSDGLAEDLITALSQSGGMKVISRSSSFHFRDSREDGKAIGAKLGVEHLLTGSVRRADGQVRINADLVNVRDGRTLWSQRYDRPYEALFELQDEISAEVAEALKARLLPSRGAVSQSDRPPSGNLEAYGAYLQGRFHADRNTPADYEKAIEHYRRAIAIDAGYAQARAALGTALGRYGSIFLSGARQRELATEAAAQIAKALQLAPDSAYVRVAYAGMLTNGSLRWVDAEAELRRAVEIAPHSAEALGELAQAVATLGHPEESVVMSRRALARDPLSAGTWYWLSIALNSLGRYDEAEAAARRTIALIPESDVGQAQLAFVLERRGKVAEALATAKAMPQGVWREMAIGIVSQSAAPGAEADAALEAMIDHQADGAAYQIAQAYAARGNADKVFEWLERAWVNRDPGLRRLLYDPYLAAFRGDARMTAFADKIGVRPSVK